LGGKKIFLPKIFFEIQTFLPWTSQDLFSQLGLKFDQASRAINTPELG
jgi:hypothetical protein